MSGFLQKVRVLTLGTAHDLLDKAIDLNSPSMLRQYIRDLEDALDHLRNESAIQAGQVRTLSREKAQLETTIATRKTVITQLIANGKTDAARARGVEVLSLQRQLDSMPTKIDAQQHASNALDAAIAKLDAKHADMVAHLRELENIDRDSKSKEAAATALDGAGKLMAGGADISVDDIESKMRARNDVASEKFDRAMGSVQTEEDPEQAGQLDELLAGLQPKAAKTA